MSKRYAWFLAWLSFLLLFTPAKAGGPSGDKPISSALILVSNAALVSPIDPDNDEHHEWVLWPPSLVDNGSNRMLSVFSGVDWQGANYDLSFTSSLGGKAFSANNFEDLRTRGYFRTRDRIVGGARLTPIGSQVGEASARAECLLLALGGSKNLVVPASFKGPWPGQVAIFFAERSTDVAHIVSQVDRALVLEVVSRNTNRRWGAFWLMGAAWPDGMPVDPTTGVTGLIQAHSAGRLLLHPDEFRWTLNPDSEDGQAAWFKHVREVGPYLLGALWIVLAYTLGCAAYCVYNELRGPMAAFLLSAVALGPACILIEGSMSRRMGIEHWGEWLAIGAIGLFASVVFFDFLFKRCFPGSHPMLSIAVTGLLTCVATDPKWSALSGLFGWRPIDFTPEAFGLYLGYMTAIVSFTKSSNLPALWLGRLAPLVATLAGLVWGGWWLGNDPTFLALPVIALLAGEGWLKAPLLLILLFLPNRHSDPFRHGFTWAPLNCVPTADAVNAVNLGQLASFVVSPGTVGLLSSVGAIALFGDRFFVRQLRVVIHREPRLRPLAMASVGMTAMATLNPSLLPGTLMVAYGALIAFFHTAVVAL